MIDPRRSRLSAGLLAFLVLGCGSEAEEPVLTPGFVSGVAAAGTGTKFSDATCTEIIAEHWRVNETCAGPKVIISYTSGDGCTPGTLTLLHAGAEVPASTIHRQYEGGTCDPVLPDETPNTTFHRLGEAVNAADYPALEMKTLGAGRITTTAIATVSGEQLANASLFHDGAARCYSTAFSDGILRCLPEMPIFDDSWPIFGDAGCTQRLVETYDGGCGEPPPELAAHWVSTACSGSVAGVHSIAPVEIATVYTLVVETGECLPSQPSPDSRHHAVGAEVGVDGLARVTDRIE